LFADHLPTLFKKNGGKMKKQLLTMILLSALGLIFATGALAGNLVIKGSTTVLPIAQKAVEAYMKANPER
jgi:phosphate transport system substrate-binding protein